jgi:uncharacterized delta-60 repeat protein
MPSPENFMKAVSRVVLPLFFVVFASSIFVLAQPNSVDLTFNPVPSLAIPYEGASGKGVLVQPDGKLVIWGGNFAVDGVAKGEVARLNIDGTVDNSFTYCNCIDNITNVAVQPDGRLLVAGSMSGTGTNNAKVVRLNPNGSQDNSFFGASLWNSGFSSYATIVKIQADGRSLVSVSGQYCCGYHGTVLVRLNTDGSNDSGFSLIDIGSGRLISFGLTGFAIDPASGKFYLGITTFSGPTVTGSVKRYNSDGTLDTTFETPGLAPSTGNRILGLAVQADGGVLVSGRFDSVNGAGKRDLVRLLPAGNVDLNFTAPIIGSEYGQIEILQSGKILVAYNPATSDAKLARLNADGTQDGAFTMSSAAPYMLSRFALDAMQRILFLGVSDRPDVRYFRLNPNGDRDVSFNPSVSLFSQVYAVARQADGKILIAGKFTQVNGLERGSLARLNADGTIDPTLDAGPGFNNPPKYLLPQADGKIIAVGDFTTFKNVARPGIARILPDGNLDLAFAPDFADGTVTTAALQSDGKILIAGYFSSVDGVSRVGVARLNSNGSLDNSFNPVFGAGSFRDILQQPDGKIIVAGSFAGVNGFNRSNLVRLTTTGELDQTFNANGASVDRVWLQPDGKYLLTNVTISRRNADGAVDNSFVSPTFDTIGSNGRTLDSVVVQSDGSIIIGGRFDFIGTTTRHNIVRLNSTGTVDPLFFPNGASAEVRATLAQPDGKVIIGGDFSKVENISRPGIARLNVSVLRRPTPFDFDGDGRADISVVRTSTNRWYEAFSSTNQVYEEAFGSAGDILAPADFDGDGITDESIFRPNGAQWWFRSSLNGSLALNFFGANGDIPRPSDIDGDGKADFVLFRPSTNAWLRYGTATGLRPEKIFGLAGDQPLVGDFDGDGKGDLAVFRPSSGDWWYAASSANEQFRTVHWGQNGDIPVPADFDGDGKTDYAVYRPSEGGWYIFNSSNGSFTTMAFGLNGDRPVAADYDGDGRADIAVFRPSTGIWYLLQSTSGFLGYQFGISTDTAIPGSLIP